MRRRQRLIGAAALLTVASACLAGCGGSQPPMTAAAAAKYLQDAGVYQRSGLHLVPAKELQTYGDSVIGSAQASYAGVVTNAFSTFGDQPAIWQFATAHQASDAFVGAPPPLAGGDGQYVFLCGPLLVLGDTQAKEAAAKVALAKHYKNCSAIIKAPTTSNVS